MQLQIDYTEWVLEKIEINKIPNDRLEGLIRNMIKDKARRPDTDSWTRLKLFGYWYCTHSYLIIFAMYIR